METGRANAFIERVLNNPENDLAEIVHSFSRTGEKVWHVDRHVLDVGELTGDDRELAAAACAAGLALFRKWSCQRSIALTTGASISEPYLLIDDEWLYANENAAPPHVYMCIADGGAEGIEHESARDQPPLPAFLVQLLGSKETCYRICGAFDDEPGAWLIKVSKEA